MTKKFYASKSILKSRYNLRLLLINLPPVTIGGTLAVSCLFSTNTEPIQYYRFIFGVLTIILAYSFITLLIGSCIASIRLKYNTLHTYLDVVGEMLIVSEYSQSVISKAKFRVYKKLWIVKLSQIEDVYCYKDYIVIMTPARLLEEHADWLEYSNGRNGPEFDKWWYNENGGKKVYSIELKNKFSFPERIIKVIEHSSKTMYKKEEKRREYRERMLKISRKLNKTSK